MAQKGSAKDVLWLSGNEAIALGAIEAGVQVASGYPGTPATEIIEKLSQHDAVYAEWATNEKVALEVVIGASFAGVRALTAMKHVGLNVAADPLFTASYTGVNGGLVIVVADDPFMYSSQNEQDSRNYALAAKLPMLEPADPAEAKRFVKLAFEISENFDTPVLLRSCTRVAHVKGIVTQGKKLSPSVQPGIVKMPDKFVMLPVIARKRRMEMEKRQQRLVDFTEDCIENRFEWGEKDFGFITAGTSYLYVKEAFPDASVLKLGVIHPLPEKMIHEFAEQVGTLYVVEDLDPFLETRIKAMGISCHGKDCIPSVGELNTAIIRRAVTGEKGKEEFEHVDLPYRPPNMCPGCPHRGIFYNLSRLKVFVSGDIGCYTLGFLPPLSAIDSVICMGASIGVAHGMAKALGDEGDGKIVAVIGDSTFIHSGITGLINAVYNKGCSTTIILDNMTTAMTGHQPNPCSDITITGESTHPLDFEKLCHAIGVNHVYKVNPNDIKRTYETLQREIERPEPSVIISHYPCILLPAEKARRTIPLRCDEEKCIGCKTCLGLGCPAINWVPITRAEAEKPGRKESQKGHAHIDEMMCVGCGQCLPLCEFGAITKKGDE